MQINKYNIINIFGTIYLGSSKFINFGACKTQ